MGSLLVAGAVLIAARLGPPAAVLYLALILPIVSISMLRRSFEAARVGAEEVPPRRRMLRVLALGGAAATLPGVALVRPSRAAAEGEPARGPSGRIRQWGMVIDLRRCDGCQSQGTPPQCTLACIEGHKVPPPMEWIEVFENELAGGGSRFIPTPCQQCQNPPCVNVCPVTATFSTPEGSVLVDQDRCIGCRMCMAACPYDRRFFLWGEPPVPPKLHSLTTTRNTRSVHRWEQ